MKAYSVYLDTNILIMGSEKDEHKKIKEKSKQGDIILYISSLNNIEQHGKVFPKLRKKDAALRLYKNLGSAMIGNRELTERVITFTNEVIKEYEKERRKEEIEKEFWKDVKLFPVNLKSKFETLFFLGAFDPSLNSLISDELSFLNELLTKYNIKGGDALHIMNTHTGNMDCLLTWDEKLIKKTKKVDYLEFEVLTPEEFLVKK